MAEARECEHSRGVGCAAPPGSGDSTRGTCFACGSPVCPACSRRVRWHLYGRRRVAVDCLEEEARFVAAREARIAARAAAAVEHARNEDPARA